jgi:hypothetical protein
MQKLKPSHCGEGDGPPEEDKGEPGRDTKGRRIQEESKAEDEDVSEEEENKTQTQEEQPQQETQVQDKAEEEEENEEEQDTESDHAERETTESKDEEDEKNKKRYNLRKRQDSLRISIKDIPTHKIQKRYSDSTISGTQTMSSKQ